MNIFSKLTQYSGKWSLKSERVLTQEELDCIKSVSVVSSQYGCSACFFMTNGSQCYIPMDNTASAGIGEALDPAKITLRTFEKPGEDDINRVLY